MTNKLREAAAELLALKDMKDRLQRLHEMGHGTDWDDYYRRQPLAWAALRDALAEPQAEPQPVEVPEMADEQIGAVALEQWGQNSMAPPAAHRAFARAIIAERDAMWRDALHKQKG